MEFYLYYRTRNRGIVAPQILIASTTWWATPARIALAFTQSGALVSGVFPRGNPLSKLRTLKTQSHYSAAYPLRSLRKAIETTQFDLIVPCDDRVVMHLHQLYAESTTGPQRNEKICTLIERSLGDPAGYKATLNRSQVLLLAEQNGIRIPRTSPIRHLEDLQKWGQQYGFPAVLKVDGTWGGSGVRVVHSWPEAERAYGELTQPLSLNSIISHVSFHNFFPLLSRSTAAFEVTVQTHIEGSLANAMFACWKGEVLGALGVDVLFSQEKLGASTIVRTSSHQNMRDAGRIIAKIWSLSGFFGLDFILEAKTGIPYLIELNPRATQLGHLEFDGCRSLTKTLYDCLTGAPLLKQPQPEGQTIAFFPQSLQCDSENPLLSQADIHHDVPWDEPALVNELKRRPWNDRRLSALLHQVFAKVRDRIKGNRTPRTTKRFELKSQRSDN